MESLDVIASSHDTCNMTWSKWPHLALIALLMTQGSGEALAMTNSRSTGHPVHIGRFSVVVPSKAQIHIDAKFQGIQVTDQGAVTSFEVLKQRLQKQSEKYAASKVPSDPEDDAILRAGGADPTAERTESQLIGFDVHAENNEAVIAYLPEAQSLVGNIELHKWIDGHDVVLSRNRIGASDYAVQRADLLGIAKHFKSRAALIGAKHIPSGFIVENGIFLDEGSPEPRGNVTLVVADPQHPDMNLTFIATDIEKPSSEPPLSASVDDELDRLRSLTHDLKVIHRGERTAAGQSGYLIAVSSSDPDNPGSVTYKYLWEAPGAPNDVRRPAISVELNTSAENHTRSSFESTQEVTEYFDRFLNSIEFRSDDKLERSSDAP